MVPIPETRHSLLVRLAEPDDQAAWEEFVSSYQGAVFGYCTSHGLQDADAREVVQDVLMLVHQRIGQWQPSGRAKSFRLWLLRTAHHLCLKAIRDRAKIDRAVGGTSVYRQVQDLPEGATESEQQQLEWQRWAFRWGAEQIQRDVKPITWQAFWLSAVECLPPEQVASRLKMRVGTVYTSKCRVLARIRERVMQLSRSES